LRGTREVKDTYQIIRLAGLLDAFSEPTFKKVLTKSVEDGPKSIVLDLSKIDFIDSSGLGSLVQLFKKVQTEQGKLQIVTNPRVTQTMKMVHLEQFFSLNTTLEAAVDKLKA
jgi:anti-anti-sigma factor